MTRNLSSLLLIALIPGCTTMMSHPELPASGQFVTQLGIDTLAIERYTRTADRLEGDVALRSPRIRVVHYSAALDATGKMTSLALTVRRPTAAAAAPAMMTSTTIFGPSTTVEVFRNGQRDTVNSGTRTYSGLGVPTIPTEPPSYGIYEQIIATNPVSVGAGAVHLTQVGGPGSPISPLALSTRGSGAVQFSSNFFPGTPWIEVVDVDGSGRVTGVNSMGTTVKTIAHRDDALDFNRVLQGWEAQEASGVVMGNFSPIDTTRATVAGSNLEIVYSRPSKRGRVIFGNVVPWGEVWRTGANAATQLTTSRDLMFGNTLVPAGKYTLWTLPTRDGAQLIINSQTGQWGTDYDPKRDLARLTLTTTMLPTPTEKFGIAIDPAVSGGVLRMAWDDRQYSIPFTVK